jgi:lysyl-tRNA synthetase class II
MGKASFAHIQDSSAQIQLFVTRDELPEGFDASQTVWQLPHLECFATSVFPLP